MDDAADLRDRIEQVLAGFFDDAVGMLTDISVDLAAVTDVARRFVLEGGKRLRPAFCYWGYRAVGGAERAGRCDPRVATEAAVIRAAASLELLQACALVHDDVIDSSDTRRGMPAAHRRFAALHRTGGWHGDPIAFGEAVAILLGDLFLVWADTMLTTSGSGVAAMARARPVYDAMRVELMSGQYLDVLEQALGGGSVERSLRVARYKSAKYTVERPVHLGAALGDASAEQVAALRRYGIHLGEAFQLRDDLLGVLGDAEVTGKPAGDDLREGKRTVLIALTLRAASAADRDVVARHLGDPALDAAGVSALREVVSRTGADRQVEAMITERVATARAALDDVSLETTGRDQLVALAGAATDRVG